VNRLHQGDFAGAKKYFNQAYNLCKTDYLKKSTFAVNRDAMTLAIEGQKQLNAGQYGTAASKFREARNKAATSDIKHVMQTLADSAHSKLPEKY
jgi:Flp pilus assembly protein TadD